MHQRRALAGGDDVADRRAHQARHPGEGGDEGELFPQGLHHVLARLVDEIGAEAGLGQRLDPGRAAARALAEGERMEAAGVDHLALGAKRRRDLAEAAEDARGAERGVERVEMPEPVEQRDDESLAGHGRADGGDGGGKVPGLARQEHDIEAGPGRQRPVGRGDDRLHRHGRVAGRALETEAAGQRRRARRADEEGHVAPGGGPEKPERPYVPAVIPMRSGPLPIGSASVGRRISMT